MTGFERFGEMRTFALEVRLAVDPDPAETAPHDAVGSWGAWRLWVSGINLCHLEIDTPDGAEDVREVRWYLAPLARWLSANWNPLLHEARFPSGVTTSEAHPRDARAAYLDQLSAIGGEDRFAPWQDWAKRHSLRACSEGGIVPDVFFQRVGDDIELSWGDRVQPGADTATFVIEPGVAHAPVGDVAAAIDGALTWFNQRVAGKSHPWVAKLKALEDARHRASPEDRLAWFLDGPAPSRPLSGMLGAGSERVRDWLRRMGNRLCLSPLAPEVAMFGAVSPDISPVAGATLLGALLEAAGEPSVALETLVEESPAWRTESPWRDGYALARDILEEADPSPNSSNTDIETILSNLGVRIVDHTLGDEGPRGVAIAGEGYIPTIVVNTDYSSNTQDEGRRFTLAHELCHLLFDRDRAKSVFHSSSSWAHPAVEQRANAFAAMLLMPEQRLQWAGMSGVSIEDLRRRVNTTKRRLRVGRVALIRHLANLGLISENERDLLLAQRYF